MLFGARLLQSMCGHPWTHLLDDGRVLPGVSTSVPVGSLLCVLVKRCWWLAVQGHRKDSNPSDPYGGSDIDSSILEGRLILAIPAQSHALCTRNPVLYHSVCIDFLLFAWTLGLFVPGREPCFIMPVPIKADPWKRHPQGKYSWICPVVQDIVKHYSTERPRSKYASEQWAYLHPDLGVEYYFPPRGTSWTPCRNGWFQSYDSIDCMSVGYLMPQNKEQLKIKMEHVGRTWEPTWWDFIGQI